VSQRRTSIPGPSRIELVDGARSPLDSRVVVAPAETLSLDRCLSALAARLGMGLRAVAFESVGLADARVATVGV
jgi:hypothetical protein